MAIEREFTESGPLKTLWLSVEKAVNRGIASGYNPFYYLGAIGIFFLWTILVTGLYLFLFYSISASGAYLSVQNITVNQWYLGGVMRSVHRYASDGLVIVMVLHALRCFVFDRYKHSRWIAWVSGVSMAWIIIAGGIFGYWMVWDEKAKFVATLSAHMLENIPIFGLPMSLNFASPENLTDQLFYIVLFIHFSSIFFLFILILFHLSRITKAIINPPKTIAWGLIIALLALSFIKPAASAPPADVKTLTEYVRTDWFYMFAFPLLKFMSAHQLWAFLVGVSTIISVVPWLTASRRKPPVKVALENCTGCELCMEDCPYMAIQMRKRTDGLNYPLEAVVKDQRCTSCGICVGACDYKALSLPDISEEAVKEEVRRLAAELKETPVGGTRVFVFACAKGAWLDRKDNPKGRINGLEWARVINLPCIGMLQPSMLSIPFEKGLDGVYIAACRPGDCDYRRGNEWLTGRISGVRPPVIKRSIDRARLRFVQISAVEKKEFVEGLKEFQKVLAPRPSGPAIGQKPKIVPATPRTEERR